MGNLRITELDQSESEQIQSDSPSHPEAEYQVDVFTLPPNHNSPDGRRQISVVSLDSESFATPSAIMAAVLQVFEGLPQIPEIAKAHAHLHIAATQA
jgi:hypothetical protein